MFKDGRKFVALVGAVTLLATAIFVSPLPGRPSAEALLLRQAPLLQLAHQVEGLGHSVMGGSFGGVYLDLPNDRLHVMFKDSGFAAAEVSLMRHLGASNLISFDRVSHSSSELLALRDRIAADKQKLAQMGVRVVSYGPDYAHNRVDLGVAGLTPVLTAQLTARYGAGMLNIHSAGVNSNFDVTPGTVAPGGVAPTVAPASTVPTTLAPPTVAPAAVSQAPVAPTTLAPTTVAPSAAAPTAPAAVAPTQVAQAPAAASTLPPVSSGQNIVQQTVSGGRRATLLCSVGALATFTQSGVPGVFRGVITAGHCMGTAAQSFQVGSDGTKIPLGSVVADTDNRGGQGAISDSELIKLDDPSRALPVAVDKSGQMLPITAASAPVVGQMAFKFGITTGLTSAPVVMTDQSSTFGQDGGGQALTVNNLAAFGAKGKGAICQEGDSGGGIFASTGQTLSFLGTLVGGPSDGSLCFFSPVQAILQAFQAQGITIDPMKLQPTAQAAPAANQPAPTTTVTQQMPSSVAPVASNNLAPQQVPTQAAPSAPTTVSQTPARAPTAPTTVSVAPPARPKLGPAAPSSFAPAPAGPQL